MTAGPVKNDSNKFFLVVAWEWLTNPHPSITEAGVRSYAALASGMTLALVLPLLIGFTASGIKNGLEHAFNLFGPALILVVTSYVLTRTPWYRLGAFIFSLGFGLSGYISIINGTTDSPDVNLLLYIPLGLILGSALLNSWELFLQLGLMEAAIFSIALWGIPYPEKIEAISGIVTAIGLVLIVLNNTRNKVEQLRIRQLQATNVELNTIRENLEKRVDERTEELNRRSLQLEAAALVSRAAAEVRTLSELLDNVVQQITSRFGYYHAAIFLKDTAEQHVVLQAASSDGGRKMLERGYQLEIGRQGLVGTAAYQKRSRIAQDVGADAIYFDNPDLPNTHSEVALPLLVQNQLIGVLDIQSTDTNIFSVDDLSTLQTMADQIALAIENARLLEESKSTLEQLNMLNATNAGAIWNSKLGESTKGYMYTQLGITPLEESKSQSSDGGKMIELPINLRGKSIGTIKLKRKSDSAAWIGAEREMVERIAIQVALAVENARLLEESQRRALREQTVNELSNRFSRSLDVDALLQNAIQELHRLPQVSDVTVFINPVKETDQAK